MGRLNYTNRKIEGVKLGQVVAKDLTKRIPPSSGSKAALRDPVVEIDVSAKHLTSEGFAEVAIALVDSIKYEGVQGKIVRLEELCLKDNQLDATSLPSLSSVIQLASNDLRDLDLSGNKITINTPAEVTAWEELLVSFSKCCVLRRLDFSGNCLGPKAFEILAKVYASEAPVDLVLSDNLEQCFQDADIPAKQESRGPGLLEGKTRKLSIVSEPEGFACDDEIEPRTTCVKRRGLRHGSKSPEKIGQNTDLVNNSTLYSTTSGLRSIPYLVFSNTSMNDTCALYLSYILAEHNTPQRLLTRVPPAKAGPPQQLLTAYDHDSQCRGIIYLPNASLGNAGMKVLDLSEAARQSLFDAASYEERSEVSQTPNIITDEFKQSLPETGVSAGAISAANRRRATMTGGIESRAIEQEGHTACELDRARSRIQGNTLQEVGQHANDLWRLALKMLMISRDIQPQKRGNLPPPPPPGPKVKPPIVKTLEVPGVTLKRPKPRLPSVAPLAPASSNQTLSPRTSHVRKKSGSTPSTPTVIPPTPMTPRTLILTASSPRMSAEYRSNLPCGLPENAWWRILGFAVGAEGVLSESQQKSVLGWAMNRKTLSRESECLGLKEATQIWRILDGMSCLAYEART